MTVREQKPIGAKFKVDSTRVARFRAKASHLTKRLSGRQLEVAAYGGLQDSAPRAALLSLHARAANVEPISWEDPALVQVWFRGADYVVPRKDVAVFSIGTLPRDPDEVSVLNRLADRVVDALGGRPRAPKEIVEELKDLQHPFLIRSVCRTGKLHIRWDASKIELVPAKPPKADPEEARFELVRRFLHWIGPAGPLQFAKWAGISSSDAQKTWESIRGELLHVDFADRGRWILASDESMLREAPAWTGVRFLPQGDPFLYLDHDLIAPANRKPFPKPNTKVSTRLINSLTGRILVDGSLVGAWGRVQNRMTLFAWSPITKKVVERISTEAAEFERPIGSSIDLRWLA